MATFTQETPVKSVKLFHMIKECILCGKLPTGKIRRLFKCASDEANVPLNVFKEAFDVDFEFLRNTDCRYCVSCFKIIEKYTSFRQNIANLKGKAENLPLISTPVNPRFKRCAVGTPTPQKSRHSKKRLLVGSLGDHTYHSRQPVSEQATELFNTHLNTFDSTLTDEFTKFLIETDTVLDNLCSKTRLPGPSCLSLNPEDLLSGNPDVLNAIILELENLPKLLQVLQILCCPLQLPKENAKETVAMMYAMGMYSRNRELNAVQTIVACEVLNCHANNRLLNVLHKCSLSLPESSKIHLLDNLAKIHTHGIIDSLRKGSAGKLTMDNIDGRTIASQIRLSSANKDYHYTALTYIPDRVALDDLPSAGPLQSAPNTSLFYNQGDEERLLKGSLKVLIGRVLVEHLPELKWMKPCVAGHIKHQYFNEMQKKSEVFPMRVIFKDPKYTGQCVDILQETKDTMRDCYNKAGLGDAFGSAAIILGGDQLVRVRMKTAKGLMMGAHTEEDRLDMFHPIVIEMFHMQQDFLEKLFLSHWRENTVRSPGTLANLAAFLGRTDVSGNVKKNFRAHDDFIKTLSEALILELSMKVLGMQKREDLPKLQLPENITRMHKKNREKYADEILLRLVDYVFTEMKQQVNPVLLNVSVPGNGNFNITIDGKSCIPGKSLVIHLPGTNMDIKYVTEDTRLKEDHLYNYCLRLLRWSVLYLNFDDAIKEGDPFRLNVTMKAMLPFFFCHSSLTKYGIEIIDFITKTEAALNPKLAMRVRLGSFINSEGGPGKNKAADMQQENNIKMIKRVIKGLGTQKTEKSMGRATAAACPLTTLASHHEQYLGIKKSERGHTSKPRTEDVYHLLNRFSVLKPFSNTPGRKLQGFVVSSSPVYFLDREKYEEFLQKNLIRTVRATN